MRSYNEYCGLSCALDMIGERWTILVIRELMTGPKRYTDLAENLPGIGTSLLATRLKSLEDDDLIRRRTLPPPAASTVYELSDIGAELADALMPLTQWGLRHALPPQPREDDHLRATWSLLPFARMPEEALAGIDASYRFDISGEVATLRIQNSRAEVLVGDAVESPDVFVEFEADVVPDIGTGRLSSADAVASGRIKVDGDPDAALALMKALDSRPAGA